MTKEEILERYLNGRNVTREHTTISLELLLRIFPEESQEVLQSVVEEYNSKIALEAMKLSVSAEATMVTSDTVQATYPGLSQKAAEKIATQINASILFELQKKNNPITAENTFLELEFLQRCYPDVSVTALNEVVERYNSNIILESLKENSDITVETTTVRPEALIYAYPILSDEMAARISEDYNVLVYMEMLKENFGPITRETAFIENQKLKTIYPDLPEHLLDKLGNQFNALLVFERERANNKITYASPKMSPISLGSKYPEVSAEALVDVTHKYNSEIILKQLVHDQTPTADGTTISVQALMHSYPEMPIEYLQNVVDAYNGMILHEITVAQGIDSGDVKTNKTRVELTPDAYKILKPMLGTEAVTLVIRNVSELSPEDLDKMPSVERIVIRDGDNTPKTGHQCMPYTRLEYTEATQKLNTLLKDIPSPQNPEEELSVFMQIFRTVADSVEEYDKYAITKKGEADKRLEKTCRNLYGGLAQGKCVCAGFADILRNAAACKGIEVKYIQGFEEKPREGKNKIDGHAWNQVCINGQWLNVDLTWALEKIKANGGQIPQNMLVLCSDEQFKDHDSYCVDRTPSEKKCPRTLEEVMASPKVKLGHATRHFATDSKGKGIRLSEVRRIGDFFGKILGVNRGAHQREQDEIQA